MAATRMIWAFEGVRGLPLKGLKHDIRALENACAQLDFIEK